MFLNHKCNFYHAVFCYFELLYTIDNLYNFLNRFKFFNAKYHNYTIQVLCLRLYFNKLSYEYSTINYLSLSVDLYMKF